MNMPTVVLQQRANRTVEIVQGVPMPQTAEETINVSSCSTGTRTEPHGGTDLGCTSFPDCRGDCACTKIIPRSASFNSPWR
eukprot:6491972-Amphidinium_carterae.1